MIHPTAKVSEEVPSY